MGVTNNHSGTDGVVTAHKFWKGKNNESVGEIFKKILPQAGNHLHSGVSAGGSRTAMRFGSTGDTKQSERRARVNGPDSNRQHNNG
jgi:hypothetical protein